MGLRKKVYRDVVAYPAAVTAGTAVTYTSSEYYEFEPVGMASFAIVNSTLVADYLTAGTIIVSPQVSFDGGDSWLIAGTVAGYQDFDAAEDVEAVAEITTYVGSASGGDQVSEYDGRWFALYSGTTPTVVWYDITGSDSVPTHGISGAAEVDVDINAAGDTIDAIQALVASAVDALDDYGAVYTSGTDTMVITNATAGASTNANAGNLLTATAVVDSFTTTTMGIDEIAGATTYNHIVDIAPRVRVQGILDSSAALTAGHGIQTDIVMEEVEYGMRKKAFADVMTIGATEAIGFNLYSTVMVTDARGLDQMKRVWLFTYATDLSKPEDAIRYVLQASDDNVNWRACSAVGTDIANGSGILHSVTSVTSGSTYYLGRYLRVNLYDNDDTGILASGHGIQFNVVIGY